MKRAALSILALCAGSAQTTFAQWQQVPTGFPYANHLILAVVVVDQNVVWAATDTTGSGFCSRIMRTTDGGLTWTANAFPGSDSLYTLDMDAIDANTAWIATNQFNGGGGGLFKTTDGGSTWTIQRHHASVFVSFFDAQNGVSVNQQEVFVTTNGGATWDSIGNVPSYLPNEFNIINSGNNTRADFGDTVWIPTSQGRVYRSTNRGRNWTVAQTALGQNACITSLAFRDGTDGLAVSSLDSNINYTENRVARTTDGGITWTELAVLPDLPTANSLAHVPGALGTYVIVGGGYNGDASGCIYTTNNGDTWTTLDSVKYNALQFLSPTVGWAGGITGATNGGMYKWTGDLFVPPSASTQWQIQTTINGNPPLYSISTMSDRVAWIGSFDSLYRTTNGGANWVATAATPTSTEEIAYIAALSATTAFVGGGGPGGEGAMQRYIAPPMVGRVGASSTRQEALPHTGTPSTSSMSRMALPSAIRRTRVRVF